MYPTTLGMGGLRAINRLTNDSTTARAVAVSLIYASSGQIISHEGSDTTHSSVRNFEIHRISNGFLDFWISRGFHVDFWISGLAWADLGGVQGVM